MVGLHFDCLRTNARGAKCVGQQQHVDAARALGGGERDRARRIGATRLTVNRGMLWPSSMPVVRGGLGSPVVNLAVNRAVGWGTSRHGGRRGVAVSGRIRG